MDLVQEDEASEPAVKKKKKKGKKKKGGDSGGDFQGFTILGDPTDQKIKKATRVLPLWLANPDILSVDLLSSQLAVSDMPGLEEKLVDKLRKENVNHFLCIEINEK